MIKGLKPGTSYRVRVVARDTTDPIVHSTDEVLVAVPGEAACLRVRWSLCFSFVCLSVFLLYPFFSHPIFFLLDNIHAILHLDSFRMYSS